VARVMALRSEKAVSGHRSASYVAMRYDGNMAHVVGAMAEGGYRHKLCLPARGEP